jgi:hypothetical protein
MPRAGSNIMNKIILLILAIAVTVAAVNFTYIYFRDIKASRENEQKATQFLEYIQNGDLKNANDLWPTVYTYYKDNEDFLDEFSSILNHIYNEYYTLEYVSGEDSDNHFEIARIYNSFISEDDFHEAAMTVYDDYVMENITYQSFLKAQHDFYFFSGYSSNTIKDIFESGQVINESRNSYYLGVEEASVKRYQEAIDYMNMVSTKDPIYYPLSLKKIDEYIEALTEFVENGS